MPIDTITPRTPTRPKSCPTPTPRIAAVIAIALAAHAHAQTTDWLTFAANNQRTGYNAAETTLTQATAPQLKLKWTARLGSPASTQPLVVHSVGPAQIPAVYVGTTAGLIAAFNATTGAPLWTAQLGAVTPCNQGPRGISGTPTIDIANTRLFAVDALGFLHALDLATGAEQPGYPVQVVSDPFSPPHTLSHGSPTLVGNSLYIVAGSSCPDALQPFHGQVVQFDLPTATVTTRWYPMGAAGPSGAGIWGPGGVSATADGAALFAATGNALGTRANTSPAESIVALSPSLAVKSVHTPITFGIGDYDFGATPLLFTPAACPPMLAALNKSGIIVVYDPANLTQGPLQTMTVGIKTGAGDLLGIPAFDPATNAIYFESPTDSPDGTEQHGLIALQADSKCHLNPLWNTVLGQVGGQHAATPVTVAANIVWLQDALTNQLVATADDTGTVLWSSATLRGKARFVSSPTVVNGQVFAGTADGRLFAFGL